MSWQKTIQDFRGQTIKEDSVCVICGSIEKLTIDHIIPLSVLAKMGIDKFTAFAYDKNFMILCRQCNTDKKDLIIRELPQTKEAIKQIFNL